MKRSNLLVVAQSALAVSLVVLAVAVIVPPPRSTRRDMARSRVATDDAVAVTDPTDDEEPLPSVRHATRPRSAESERLARRPRAERLADRGDRAFDVPPRRGLLSERDESEDALPPAPPSEDLRPIAQDDESSRRAPSNRGEPEARSDRRVRRQTGEQRIELGPIDDTIGGVPYRQRTARTYSTALSGNEDQWVNLRIVVEQQAARDDAVARRNPTPEPDATREAAVVSSRVDARLDALSTQIESLGREQNARQQLQMERSARMLERSQHATQLLEVQRRLLELRAELGEVRQSASAPPAVGASRDANAEAYRRDPQSVPASASPSRTNPFDEPPANRATPPDLPVAPPGSASTGSGAPVGLAAASNQGTAPVSVSTTTSVAAAAETGRGDGFLAPVVTAPAVTTASAALSARDAATPSVPLASNAIPESERLPQINPGPPFHRRETTPQNAYHANASRLALSRSASHQQPADSQASNASSVSTAGVRSTESPPSERNGSDIVRTARSTKPLPRYQLKKPIDAPDPPEVVAVPSPPDSQQNSPAATRDRSDVASSATNDRESQAAESSTEEAATESVATTAGVAAATTKGVSDASEPSPSSHGTTTATTTPSPSPSASGAKNSANCVRSVPNNVCCGTTPARPKPVSTTRSVPATANGATSNAALTPSPDRAYSKAVSSKAPAPRTSSGPRGDAKCDVCSPHAPATVGTAGAVQTASATSVQPTAAGSGGVVAAAATTPTPKAAQLTPERTAIAKAQYTRARELFAAGDTSQAALHARRALEIRPDYPEARQLLAQIEAAGRKPTRSKLWPFHR